MSRIYRNFADAANEIKRDLAELAIKVPPMYQSKDVSGDKGFVSHELSNYLYTVTDADYSLIPGTHDAWIEVEWVERLAGGLNPGRAWLERPEVWEELREVQFGDKGIKQATKGLGVTGQGFDYGRFSYTYSERMGGPHIDKVIAELKEHPYSRQLWLPVWWPIDEERRGKKRVPCSLGYQFMFRNGKLHMTYTMRSCDFITHWPNDVCLASMLLHYVARKAEMKVGTFSQVVFSLHAYEKDLEGVF